MSGTPSAINPFNWTDAVQLADAVSRRPFTERVAMNLKGGTHTALFGPRGTGKSSFLLELGEELSREHGSDGPAWDIIVIDLRRAISRPAFIGTVADALAQHPNRALRRRGAAAIRDVEKEVGINLGVVKAGVKSTAGARLNEGEILVETLRSITRLSDRIVVAFDEFQRLNSCPGEPLSLIRSALLGPDRAGQVSLVLTGSLRERLDLMLKTDTEPIWSQTLHLELPELSYLAFLDYLQLRFEASGKPIDDDVAERLVHLGDNHPKRTQQLAWHTWDRARGAAIVNRDDVDSAYEFLLGGEEQVAQVVDTMMSGSEPDINEAKTLFLIGGGSGPGSGATARRYGLGSNVAALRATTRLEKRGLVFNREGEWRVVDPLLAEWLRRNDPLGIGEAPGGGG